MRRYNQIITIGMLAKIQKFENVNYDDNREVPARLQSYLRTKLTYFAAVMLFWEAFLRIPLGL